MGANLGWRFDSGAQAFDTLADGETLVLRYTLRATDSSAATATRNIVITVAGSNDAPRLSPVDVGGVVTEDRVTGAPAALRDSGSLGHADIDASDLAMATVSPLDPTGFGGAAVDPALAQGLAAALTLTGDGAAVAAGAGTLQWDFTLDNALAQGLGSGESVSARYRIAVTDDSGAANARAVQDIEVLLEGTNDRPVITAIDVAGAAVEGAPGQGGAMLRDAGSLTFADADTRDFALTTVAFQTAARSSGAAIGTALQAALANAITLAGAGVDGGARAGTVAWSFALGDALVQGLAEGETLTAGWRVSVSDDSGAADADATQDLTVTVTGANDAPTVGSIDTEGRVTEDAASGSSSLLRDSGTLAFADADLGDAVRASVQWHALTTTGGAVLSETLRQAIGGALSLGGDGVATAVPSGTVRWSFDLDNALVQSLASGQALEAIWRVSLQDSTGAVTTQDVRVSIAGVNDAPTLQVTAPPAWVEADDAGAQSLDRTQAIRFGDVDAGDTVALAWTYGQDIAWTGGMLSPGLTAALTQDVFGIDSAPAGAPGTVTWRYRAPGVDLDFLGAGERISFSYGLSASDGSATTATDTVPLAIEGRNDAPVIVDSDLLGAVTEGAASGAPPLLRDSGWLEFRDRDANDLVSASSRHVGVSGQGGARADVALTQALSQALTLSGAGAADAAASGTLNWTFALDPALLSHLGAGQSLSATWRIDLSDDSAASDARTTRDVVVTLRGANSAPTLDADMPQAFTEALDGRSQALAQSGTVHLGDADDAALLQLSVAYNGDIAWSRPGGTLDATRVAALTQSALRLSASQAQAPGSVRWDYQTQGLDLDFLGAGETISFSFTVKATDAEGAAATQRLAFSIVGSSETPSSDGIDLSGAVTEDRTGGVPAALRDAGAAGFNGMDPLAPSGATLTFLDASADRGGTVDAGLASALAAALQLVPAVVDPATRVGLIPWSFQLDNALAQGLRAGETVQARWRIALVDDPSLSQDVSVTVHGVNDTPTLSATTSGASLAEDSSAMASGRLEAQGSVGFSEVDRTEAVRVSSSWRGVTASGGVVVGNALTDALASALTLAGPGTASAASGGTVSWRFDLDNALVQFLGAGEALTATWRLQLRDDSGSATASAFHDVAVTITGANDTPSVTVVQAGGTLSEDAASGTPARLRHEGAIDFADADGGDLVRASAALYQVTRTGGATANAALDAALAQALSLSGAGAGSGTNTGTLTWRFELDPALVQSLAAGQSVSATWRLSFSDDSASAGATRTQDVTITLDGADDAPVVSAVDVSGSVTEDLTSGALERLRDSGRLEFAAVDNGQRLRAQVTLLGSTASSSGGVSAGLAQALASALSLAGDGVGVGASSGALRWDFALDNALAQVLGAGESVTATWRITFTDDSGSSQASTAQDVRVTVHGANDAPVVTSAAVTGTVTEDITLGTPTLLRQRGSLGFADTDTSDKVRATVAPAGVAGLGGAHLETAAGQALKSALANALTLSGPGSSSSAASGTVEWDFVLDNGLAQFLGAGESVIATWKLRLSDDSGAGAATTEREIVVTITGTNDGPVLTAIDVSGSVSEDATAGEPARLRDSGSVAFVDADAGDLVRAGVTLQSIARSGGAPTSAALDAALAQAVTLSGAGAASGAGSGALGWAFVLDPALVQALGPGQAVTATWRLSLSDDSGSAEATRTQDITVTITGANDAPVVTEVSDGGSLTEDITSGIPALLRCSGSLAYADLDAGQTVRAEAVWRGSAAAGGAVVGTALAEALAGALKLSGGSATAGRLQWEVVLDNGLVQHLAAGQSVIATWRVLLTDDSGAADAATAQDVTVTIRGANDLVVIGAIDANGTVTQGVLDPTTGRLRDQGSLSFADADAGAAVRIGTAVLSVVQASAGVDLSSAAGAALVDALATALSLDSAAGATAAGSVDWTFLLDDVLARFLGAGEAVTATWRIGFSDAAGDPTSTRYQDVVVTIIGANDKPEAQPVRAAATLSEDAPADARGRLSAAGSFEFLDPDAGDLVRASIGLPSIVRAPGTPEDSALDAALGQALGLSGAGAASAANQGTLDWVFTLDAALAQKLAGGHSVSATWRVGFSDDSGSLGSTHTQEVAVTLTGANDAPVITTLAPTGRVVEDATAGASTSLRDGGTLAFAAVDTTQRVRASATLLGVTAPAGRAVTPGLRTALDSALSLSGDGGSYSANAGTLRWDFALDNALAQYLGEDQSVVATWRLTLSDDAGAADSAATRDLSITIAGVNDDPRAGDDRFGVALGAGVEGALIAGSDTDTDADPLRISSVAGRAFATLAASTDPARPADDGWRQVALEHGTLYLREDGQSAYRHGGRAFLVTPLSGSGTLEQRQDDGAWRLLTAPTRLTLEALRAGSLRYTPGLQELAQPSAAVASWSELDWRSDGVDYTVSDGRANAAPARVSYAVGAGAGEFGTAVTTGSDADVDGIDSRVEGLLATRVTGVQGLQSRAYALLPAHLESGTAGQAATLRLQAGLEGDLNRDGRADALQNAVTTFAWIGHDQFTLANADPEALGSTRSIVTLVAEAALTGWGQARDGAQLADVQVTAMSPAQTLSLESRLRFGTDWSPLSFSAIPEVGSTAGAAAAAFDLDPTRDGVQWRFTVDLSHTGETESRYLGFLKWVDAGTIQRYQHGGTVLVDLDDRDITEPGWVDFSRRADKGDGARLLRSADGRLMLDIVITDNRFGDSDTRAGRVDDPGLPVFINEQDDRRPLTVTSPAVNEASPWACFEVRGAARQIVTLALEDGSATAGLDYAPGSADAMDISSDGGVTWTRHAGGPVRLSGGGSLLVRTALVDDARYEKAETFRLVARSTGGLVIEGVATLLDDGRGVVFRSDASTDPAGRTTDDRPRLAPPPPQAPAPAAHDIGAPRLSGLMAGADAGAAATRASLFDSALLPTRQSTLGVTERVASSEILTSAAGFQAVVIESSRAGLSLYRPVADQFFPSNRTVSFSLPSDTFAHSMADAVLKLDARLGNGRALPAWLVFDARTGTFTVTPPAGFGGELEIRVVARDQQGREASTLFKLKVTSGVMVNPGRPSLSEQLGAAPPGLRPAGALPSTTTADRTDVAPASVRSEAVKRPLANARATDRPVAAERTEANAAMRARR